MSHTLQPEASAPAEARHTPEPWHVCPMLNGVELSGHYRIGTKHEDGHIVASYLRQNPRNGDNAARIVACVNGCARINPKAVPELVGALRAMLRWSGALPPSVSRDLCDYTEAEATALALAALAKAEGGAL